jgi:carboxyl-terminal processing protease
MNRALPWLLLGTAGCPVVPSTLDLSDEPIDQALRLGIDHLEQAYSFTDHKGVDWQAVRRELQPLADEAGSPEEEARVIRGLVPYLPDAHVQLFHEEPSEDLCPEARGSYGLALSDLDDGRVIVAHPGETGLVAGDEVVAWGGRPLAEAREDTALWCFPLGAATNERRRQVQLRLLARGPVGASVVVTVLREGPPVDTELAARPDTDDIRAAFSIELPETLLERRLLPSGLGYVAVGWEETYLAETRFQSALVAMRDAPGLVVDLRDNDGGMDMAAANIAGMFSTSAFFYETITFLNNRTLEQEVIAELWVEPQEVYWGRPTAVLIDGDTVSSGEGLALLLSKQPQVQIFGFEGTAASFGSTGSAIAFPGGWQLAFPGGRSLDERGDIQLDSDRTLEGGVHPTRRVPWTEENRVRHHDGEDVVLEAAVAWLQEVTK